MDLIQHLLAVVAGQLAHGLSILGQAHKHTTATVIQVQSSLVNGSLSGGGGSLVDVVLGAAGDSGINSREDIIEHLVLQSGNGELRE